MSDEANALALLEQYKRQYGMGTPTGADTVDQGKNALVRAFEAVGRPAGAAFGGAMHVAGIPARMVNAIGTNLAGTQAPVDVSDVAIYGQDMETGRQSADYGGVLAGTLADEGEITPGGRAEKLIRILGNIVSDPLTAAGAARLLVGRAAPAAAAAERQPRMPPQSRLYPQYAEGGPGGGIVNQPPPPSGAMPARAPGPPRTSPPGFDPTATQPVQTVGPKGPKPRLGGPRKRPSLDEGGAKPRLQGQKAKPELERGPTETQPVKIRRPKKSKPKEKEESRASRAARRSA